MDPLMDAFEIQHSPIISPPPPSLSTETGIMTRNTSFAKMLPNGWKMYHISIDLILSQGQGQPNKVIKWKCSTSIVQHFLWCTWDTDYGIHFFFFRFDPRKAQGQVKEGKMKKTFVKKEPGLSSCLRVIKCHLFWHTIRNARNYTSNEMSSALNVFFCHFTTKNMDTALKLSMLVAYRFRTQIAVLESNQNFGVNRHIFLIFLF